jgi:hypothetical protein
LPVVLLITIKGHTWGLLSYGTPPPCTRHDATIAHTSASQPPLYLFDPMRNELCLIKGATRAELISNPLLSLPPEEPYAGILLSPHAI